MTATCASSDRLASSRSLGPRLRHCRKPLRDTPSTLHSRAIGCQTACASIQAYFTVTPLEDPSLPARSSFTQLNKLESGIPSLRLASDTPTLWPGFTASILNSFVYRRPGTPTFLW